MNGWPRSFTAAELIPGWLAMVAEARENQIRWTDEVDRRVQNAGGDEKDKKKQDLILDAKHKVSQYIAERKHWEGYIQRARATPATADPRQPREREPGEDDDAW